MNKKNREMRPDEQLRPNGQVHLNGQVHSNGLLRPYEKCLAYGVESLTDAELLAVIIKTGTNGVSSTELADKLLSMSADAQGVLGTMQLSMQQLIAVKGIGKVKAIQIMTIFELSRRIAKTKAQQKLDFNHPEAIADYYMEDMRHCGCERLVVAMLDSKLRLICDEVLSIGTVNASMVTPREVFLAAMRRYAVHIVVLHNHPSGDPTPSGNDIAITRRLVMSGQMLGISVIDHIIIGDNRFVSLRREGILDGTKANE